MTESLFLPLLAQCDLIKSGALTSHALTQSYITRIRKHNPELNVVVRENFDAAVRRAQELDAHLAAGGIPVGPLHGIPFTIKDAFRVKGFRTSFGTLGMRHLGAFDDCTIVDRLISAGGVFLGQTNVPLSCFDWQTNSPIYGLTRNPINVDYTVGGSSGGSAASVAAFFSPFEVGSDVGGSIRYPAHCCGVFGLRPSHGFVPFHDIGPALSKEPFANIAVAGPMARSIDDLKLVFSVLTKTEDDAESKARLRIAYTLEWAGISVDERSKPAIESFIEKAKALGHELVPVTPPLDFDRCNEVWGIILGYEFSPVKFKSLTRIAEYLFNYFINVDRCEEGQELIRKGLYASRPFYLEALQCAEMLRIGYLSKLRDFDLWLTPLPEAIKHQKTGTPQELNSRQVSYSSYLGNFLLPTALLHHPILAAPIGLHELGLPIGIQLHGKQRRDWQLLADCSQLNDLFVKPRTFNCIGEQPIKPIKQELTLMPA